MGIEVQGPDGTIWEFDDGTTPEVIQRTIQRHYGTTPEAKRDAASAQSWADALSGTTAKRSAWERLVDVSEDFFQRGSLGKAGRDSDPELDGYGWNDFFRTPDILEGGLVDRALDATMGQDRGYMRSVDPKKLSKAEQAERDRRLAFEAMSREDPFWQSDRGLGQNLLHGAAALTGALAGSAVDPINYAGGGTTVLGRIGIAAATAGGTDLLLQAGDVNDGIQDRYSVEQTLVSTALGGVLQGGAESLGRMIRRPGEAIPKRPASVLKEELDASDLLNDIPLSQESFTPRPLAEADTPARLTGPEAEPDAPRMDGEPEDSRQLELFPDDPSAGPKAEADPWADVDWADTASPARKEAAAKHWEKLRAFIKPEMHQTFARYLAGETIETSGSHWNKNVFDFEGMRSNPDGILELADVMSAVYRPLYDEAGDAAKTWASTQARQQQFGIRMSDAIKAHADITSDHGVSSKIHALETIAVQGMDDLARTIADTKARIRKGDFTTVNQLAMSVEMAGMFDAMAAGSKSEIGRALNILKAQKKRSALFSDMKSQFDSLNEAMKGNLDPDKMADLLDAMDKAYRKKGAKGLSDELRKVKKMSPADYLSYYMVVGLLTTPVTFIRNVMGSTMNAGWSVSDRWVAVAFGKARSLLPNSGGSIERVTTREALAYTSGMQHAFADALAASFQAFKQARPITDSRSSVAMDGQSSFIPFEIHDARKQMWKQNGLRAVPDMLAAGTFATIRTLGLRPSIAMDEFTKVMTRRMELGALAHREAAYRTARLTDQVEASKVYDRTVKSIMDEPTAEAFTKAEQLFADRGLVDGGQQVFADDVLEEAALIIRAMDIRQMTNEFAREMSFQKIGPKMTKMEQAIGQWPILKALYVPFFRTPVALLRTGMIDHNPVLALTMKDSRDKFGSLIAAQREIDGQLQRGGAEADMVLAKMTTGAAVMAFAYGLWNQGLITGNLSKAEQEDGKQPYSIKVGDTWYAYNTMSPVAEPLGFVADIAKAFREREMSDDQFETLVGGVMVAFVNNIVNKSFLQGISDMMDLLFGSAPGQSGESRMKGGMRAASEKAADLLIPAIVRNTGITSDPVMRETDDWIQAFINNIPLVRETLPEKRDWLGRPVEIENGKLALVAPLRMRTEKSDLLSKEIAALAQLGEFDISSPPRRFNEEEITRDEQARVLAIQGQEYRHPGTDLNLEETLNQLVASDAYASWSDARRGQAVRETVSTFRRLANIAIRTPSSPHYMAEMVARTGMAKIETQMDREGWTFEQARGRARGYGIAPETFDSLMTFQPKADIGFLNGESNTPE